VQLAHIWQKACRDRTLTDRQRFAAAVWSEYGLTCADDSSHTDRHELGSHQFDCIRRSAVYIPWLK
jgi:predicted ATPase